jgi:SAM-dependent methyltransferase
MCWKKQHTEMPDTPSITDRLCNDARVHWEADRLDDALASAWQAYDAAPDEHAAKIMVARLLRASPKSIAAEREVALQRLLRDPQIDPGAISEAGWHLLLRTSDLFASGDPQFVATWLESSALALALLDEDLVNDIDAELQLTRLRRWLLMSGRSGEFPLCIEALGRQAALNGGAWLFDSEERERLETNASVEMVRTYHPERAREGERSIIADHVTRAVAEQYESWPYPTWKRVMAGTRKNLRDHIAALDPEGPDTIPLAPHMLVAGCGTGRQVALLALCYPDARITAIDISQTSLDYAAARCGEAGLDAITFQALDLHRVGELGQKFEAIMCTGVLHHLPDPEKGWAALADVLKPGGVMHVMVYSKIARLSVRALRGLLAEFDGRPVDDDMLRAARRRLIERVPVPTSRDFYSLAGVYDLFLHRHEDSFDIPRICRALDGLGLKLIQFELPTPPDRARYRAENPHDSLQRDVASWSAAERRNPRLFSGMYDFWCRKPC